eukprot:756898-Hanusia_phi.AAC.4
MEMAETAEEERRMIRSVGGGEGAGTDLTDVEPSLDRLSHLGCRSCRREMDRPVVEMHSSGTTWTRSETGQGEEVEKMIHV